MKSDGMENAMEEGKKIRVVLVDDHSLFRCGVKALLQKQGDVEVVGEASDGLEGVRQARESSPDLVMLDLHMPGIGGLEALRMIKAEGLSAKVVMLTVSEDSEDLIEAMKLGASGYLLKNIETQALVDALRRALRSELAVSAPMTEKLIEGLHGKRAAAPSVAKLTPRENEILGCLGRGLSNKLIAREFDLAESTVKIHVQSLFRKLGLTSRVQAAVYAVENGLCPPVGSKG